MDTLVVTGTIRCALCGQALEVWRSFQTQLRLVVCLNPLCRRSARIREQSHYTQIPGQPTTT